MHIKLTGTRPVAHHFAPALPTGAASLTRLAGVTATLAATICATVAAALAAPAAWAQDAQPLRTRALAATCAQCHGTDGRAEQREAFARLAGQSSDYLLTQLLAFRSGQRPATIMHQITKGYSPAQLETLAVYFSQQK
jgi:cytochrome c553